MLTKKYDVDPADIDADGLADGNSSAGASVTLDGTLTSGGTFTSADGLGRQLCIKDLGSDDQSGATFTVTGTDANGIAQTEAITGPASGATVESAKYFLTVSAIAIASPAAGATVDIGTVDEFATPVYALNARSNYGASVFVAGLSGTIQFDVDETFDNILVDGPGSANWIANQSDKSADLTATLSPHATGVRLKADSYTNAAELQFHIAG